MWNISPILSYNVKRGKSIDYILLIIFETLKEKIFVDILLNLIEDFLYK